MKKFCIVFVALIISLSSFAQKKKDKSDAPQNPLEAAGLLKKGESIEDYNALSAAEKSTRYALDLLKKNNYPEAYKSLTLAQKETKRVINETITSALPPKIDNWQIQNENVTNMIMMSQSQSNIDYGLTCVNMYMQVKEAVDGNNNIAPLPSFTDPRIIITFSNNTQIKSDVAAVQKNDENYLKNLKEGSTSKPITVKTYPGYNNYNGTMKVGEVSVVVGGATVQIEAKEIDNTDILIQLADKIDYSKVTEIFGMK